MPPAEPSSDSAPVLAAPGVPELLSSLCHDLREPLASIVMGTRFLRRSIPSEDATGRRVVDAIHRAAERMRELITSFSDLAGLQMKEVVLDVQPHDLGAVVRAAFDQLITDANGQSIEVSLEVEPGLPVVPCDRQRMLQIFRNLGLAAMRVVPEGGQILVRAGADGSTANLALNARRGPGSRPLGTQPPKPALAIARGLVELHGGTLTVRADEETLTTSFSLPGVSHEELESSVQPRA